MIYFYDSSMPLDILLVLLFNTLKYFYDILLVLLTSSARRVTVRVPATTANMGPGFDCAGMARGLCRDAEGAG